MALADGFLRIVSGAVRRYSREPETRVHSARMMLSGALALHAAEAGAGETALVCAEVIAAMAATERQEKREARA